MNTESMTLRKSTTGKITPVHGQSYKGTRWYFKERDGFIEQEADLESYEAVGIAWDGNRAIGFYSTFKEAVVALRDWIPPKHPRRQKKETP